jgi:phosphoadenosine phosphosulfate reductase
LRRLKPDAEKLALIDPNGDLWKHQPDRNEWIRKVEPFQRVLETGEFEAIITGRKAYQTDDRQNMQIVELAEDGVLRINPLHNWNSADIAAEFEKHNLPPHPLVAKGYKSIGSKQSTAPVKDGEDERAGRWAHTKDDDGKQKQECGLWVAADKNVDSDS